MVPKATGRCYAEQSELTLGSTWSRGLYPAANTGVKVAGFSAPLSGHSILGTGEQDWKI